MRNFLNFCKNLLLNVRDYLEYFYDFMIISDAVLTYIENQFGNILYIYFSQHISLRTIFKLAYHLTFKWNSLYFKIYSLESFAQQFTSIHHNSQHFTIYFTHIHDMEFGSAIILQAVHWLNQLSNEYRILFIEFYKLKF